MRAVLPSETKQLCEDEGFRGTPYQDTCGYATIGFGTMLPLTEEEARWLMMHRWQKIRLELRDRVERDYDFDLDSGLDATAVGALDNMAYNLGVPRLMQFKRMWGALIVKNYAEAADEMLDSRWASQVGARAQRLADSVRSCQS